jgi:hypothetical protein
MTTTLKNTYGIKLNCKQMPSIFYTNRYAKLRCPVFNKDPSDGFEPLKAKIKIGNQKKNKAIGQRFKA